MSERNITYCVNTHVTVRDLQSCDAAQLLEIACDPVSSREYFGGRQFTEDSIQSMITNQSTGNIRNFAAVDADTSLIGLGSLQCHKTGYRSGWYVGVCVHPKHRGKGHATNIVKCLLKLLFESQTITTAATKTSKKYIPPSKRNAQSAHPIPIEAPTDESTLPVPLNCISAGVLTSLNLHIVILIH